LADWNVDAVKRVYLVNPANLLNPV